MARKTLPQGIDQLPSGKYRSRLVVDGIQHTIGTFHTLGDARAALDIARAEKARETFEPPSVGRKRLNAEREARQAQALGDTRTVPELSEAWLSWLATSRGDHYGNNRWGRNSQHELLMPGLSVDAAEAGMSVRQAQDAMESIGYSLRAVHKLERWENKRTTGKFGR